jgi:hypothetical protein
LRVGVARRVRELGARRAVGRGPDVAIVVFASWAEDPVRGLADTIEAEVAPLVSPLAPRPPAAFSLADVVEHGAHCSTKTCASSSISSRSTSSTTRTRTVPGRSWASFRRSFLRPTLRANVLLSLRDDALARLDVYLPLDRLDRDAAHHELEVGRLDAIGVGLDARLREDVVDELRLDLDLVVGSDELVPSLDRTDDRGA